MGFAIPISETSAVLPGSFSEQVLHSAPEAFPEHYFKK